MSMLILPTLVLVDIPQKELEDIFREGFRVVGIWEFAIARKDYSLMTQRDPNQGHQGTPAPVPADVKYNEFFGHRLEDAVKWMKEKPESVDVNDHHFIILDRRAREDGTIVICRLGGEDWDNDRLEYLRYPAQDGVLYLGGYDDWRELNPEGSRTAKIEY